ncbi:hypothetical protein AZA_36879 [Nitrospirillum viridazoti Y2]|nr:hypothetical protein AZA_36879 [Nitrospirillum amazonense Y2]
MIWAGVPCATSAPSRYRWAVLPSELARAWCHVPAFTADPPLMVSPEPVRKARRPSFSAR